MNAHEDLSDASTELSKPQLKSSGSAGGRGRSGGGNSATHLPSIVESWITA